jgi:putative membrane protein
MLIRWAIAALHLLALGIGLGAIWARARALRGTLDAQGLRQVFYADNLWGLAAGLLIATGLARAFAGLEKGSAHYLHSHVFWAKMALLVGILLLEILPMATLIRWRIARSNSEPIDTRRAGLLSRISLVQAWIVVAMVLAAVALARGFGGPPPIPAAR